MKFPSHFAAIGLALLSSAAPAMTAPNAQPDVVPNQYIVTLKPSANLPQFSRALQSEIARERESPTGGVGVVPKFGHQVAIGSSFKAVTGVLTDDLVRKLKGNGQVAHIEPDRIIRAFETTQLRTPSWGLSRISRRTGIEGDYVFPDKQGEGVDVFVIDTGVQEDHPEFRGIGSVRRARTAFQANIQAPAHDEHGHGTHVAGTIAGIGYGVAKRARIHAVKVLDKQGHGTLSDMIRGMDSIASEIRKSGKTAVCNMSLGEKYVGEIGDDSQVAAERAVAALFEAGCVVVKGAGNDGQDACNTIPARSPEGLTVAALAKDGQSIDSQYSNFGRCVDIAAPGSMIPSAWLNNGFRYSSGTSMAAPHVSGAAALVLGQEPWLKPQQVVDRILARASQGVIQGDLKGTPNRVVYVRP